jgi:hypothetical protein
MSRRTAVAWGLFAVLGVALAAGVSLATAEISGQHIGLSSEPMSAGQELVPAHQRAANSKHRKRRAHKKHAKRSAAAAPAAPAPTPTSAVPAQPPAPAAPAQSTTAPRRKSSGLTKEYESESGGKHVHHEDD